MHNKVIKTYVKSILIVILVALASAILMWLVYLLPTKNMAKNVADSEGILRSQDDEKTLANSGYYDYYDTGTNIIILHEVIHPGSGNALRDSQLVPAADYFQGNLSKWIDALIDHATTRDYDDNDYQTYARYWHGYLILLKPLFLFLNLKQVYILNTIVLAALCLATVVLIFKKLDWKYSLVYLATIVLMNPSHIVRSFQLSSVFYALIVSVLLLFSLKDKVSEDKLRLVFLIDGMIIALLDFLTYPPVAFIIPLVFWGVLFSEEKTSLKEQFLDILQNGIHFIIGYGGLWACKWISATVLTEENVILDGLANVLHRVGADVAQDGADAIMIDSPIQALSINLKTFLSTQTLIIIGATTLIFIIVLCVKRKSIGLNKNTILYIVVGFLIPIAWYVVVHNHCSYHPHLEWREYVACTFSVFAFIAALVQNASVDDKD